MKFRALTIIGGLALLTTTAVLAAPPADDHPSGDLKTIMVALGEQMTRVQSALWVEDLRTVSEAARQVADHPHVSTEERARLQGALGSDFAAFVVADRAVHDAAVRLSEVAGSGDLDGTVRELAAVQAGCVSCHSQFRERLRQ